MGEESVLDGFIVWMNGDELLPITLPLPEVTCLTEELSGEGYMFMKTIGDEHKMAIITRPNYGKIARKRFIKLKMAYGLPKREAEKLAEDVRYVGCGYKMALNNPLGFILAYYLKHANDAMWKDIKIHFKKNGGQFMSDPFNKNPINQLRGAQNRAQGAIFEQIIEDSCNYYRELQLAEIDKTPEPFKVTRRVSDYQFQGHFEKQAQPDFKGTLSGGAAIVFEAKHTDSDRVKRDRVSDIQSEALDRHQSLGAKCFVIVSLQMSVFAMVPWETWKNMQKYFGHLYMSKKDLEPFRVPFNGRAILFLQGLVS